LLSNAVPTGDAQGHVAVGANAYWARQQLHTMAKKLVVHVYRSRGVQDYTGRSACAHKQSRAVKLAMVSTIAKPARFGALDHLQGFEYRHVRFAQIILGPVERIPYGKLSFR